MATRRLSDRFARSAPGPTDPKRGGLVHYDDRVTGFGLRVTFALARSWILNYTTRTSRERRYTIASLEDMRCKAAREEATRLRGLIALGGDPQEDRRQQRSAPTIADLVQRYVDQHLPTKRPSSQAEDIGLIRQWLGEWSTRKVGEIRRADVAALHAKVSTRTPVRSNRLLALLSKMFNLAIEADWCSSNPCKGVKKNVEQSRERFLSPAELGRLVEVLGRFPNKQAVMAIELLLLTGARRDEVLGAEWREFDFAPSLWRKPAIRVKGKRDHTVPLSVAAIALLGAMKNESSDSIPYLFPTSPGSAKPRLTQIDHAWRQIRVEAGLAGLRLHDIRHSFASQALNAGVALPTISKLLGHHSIMMTMRYAHVADPVLRSAVDLVGATVTGAKPAAVDRDPS